MTSLKELNGRLTTQPFVCGYTPSKEDARIFDEMFGNQVHVAQWVARMASYYQSERDSILHGDAEKKKTAHTAAAAAAAAAPAHAEAKKAKPAAADADEDIDLFGETTAEEAAALEAKKAADAAKKKTKVAPVAKSSILFDIKAWEDTVNLEALAMKLHDIERDGLVWGDYKLVPVAYGVKKLQQLVVIEDDKISGDDLEDIIMGFEDEVQSMDIVAWNKV